MKKCLFILAGWAKKDKNGTWISSGLSGDNLRTISAKYLWDRDKELFVAASGGKGKLSHIADMEPLAKILARELVELGVDRKKIIEESKSYNTYEQMVNLVDIIKKYKFDNIYIISNKWHLPRTKAIIDNLVPELKDLLSANKIKLISAEEILLKNDPEKWESIIKSALNDQRTIDLIKTEKQGIKDILSGNYKITR